jgi:hypothetical protein
MDYVASSGRITVNGELERMWKEEVVAYFKILAHNMTGGTRKPQILSGQPVSGLKFELGTSQIHTKNANHPTMVFGDWVYSRDNAVVLGKR